jgi:hypothetical protein
MSGREGSFPPKEPRQLRFEQGMLEPELANDIGDGFQHFCFELLRQQRPALRRFPTAGRDGGIDLIQDGDLGREVFECKHVGVDGPETARSRWRASAKALASHLPGKSQRQYSPWWERDPPIRKYTLCISSTLASQDQVEQLKKAIEAVFQELGGGHAHLSHLSRVDVTVMHWPDLLSELEDAPSLVFRWFPQARPLGLVPIERRGSQSLFSSFLDSTTLGYYSRDRHIAEHGRPKGGEIESEPDMLGRLSQTRGLIVTGPGGHGKTRLVNELGLLAQSQGWCVLRVVGSWRQQSLSQLAAMVGTSARVLLLLDYLEMQQGFDDAVIDLLAIHETYGLQIGYVANCRSSFYPRIAHLPQHEEVALAPEQGDEWFSDFRRYVVKHILETGGVGVNSRTLEVCRDVPVIAVFLVYLSTTGRADDLKQLLTERNFGTWVRRRLKISFPSAESDGLPALIAQFPMQEEVASRLAPVEVLSTLEKDGWIEAESLAGVGEANRQWSVIHDVLADQLLLSWLAELGSFAGAEVERLVSSALSSGTLASLLSSLQRIRDHPEAEHVPLSAILREKFAQDPDGWISQVPSVLGSSLLTTADTIAVLESNEALWRKQLSRRAVRHQIGRLAREVSGEPESPAGTVALKWLLRALEVEETDYLLRSGLFLSPSETASRAKAWIDANPTDFSTHFVVTAWLAAGLGPQPITESVLAWLDSHCRHARAWHVLTRWLSSGCEPGLIEPYVLRWLESNDSMQRAGALVLVGWLKGGGSREAVDARVIAWLKRNIESPEASVVLGRWIEAGGDLEVAKPFVEQWLGHDDDPSADRFVYLSWLNQGGSVAVIQGQVEGWLEARAGLGDIWYLMDLVVRALPKTPELAAAILDRWGASSEAKGFGEVLHGWLVGGGAPELLSPHLEAWLMKFGESFEAGAVYADLLGEENASAEVKDAALQWFLAFPATVQAGHIGKSLALEGELNPDALRAILRWCAAFPEDEDALWRLTQLGNNLHRVEVNEEVLAAAEAVSRVVLADDQLSTLRTTQLTSLCSLVVNARGLKTGVAGDRCDAILLDYARHPSSFVHGDVKLSNAQRPGLVRRIFSLMLRGWLDPDADAPGLERLLDWAARWDEPARGRAFKAVYEIAYVYSD